VKIKIDRKEIEVDEGATVLEIARNEGIDIPTLCYHEALGPYGACRLCVVEAEGPLLRRSLMTSCNLKVSEGLSVDTNSSLVTLSRKVIFELLLGRASDTGPLVEMAGRFGVGKTRFKTGKRDDCVRCGLCVRVCRDKIGASAISFAGRGQRRQVTAEFGKLSETCIGCGACANICPTAAIRLEDRGDERKIYLWDNIISKFTLIRCVSCGIPYAPRMFLDYVALRSNVHDRLTGKDFCPECVKKYYAEAAKGEFLRN
jgi:bidirectional [NiFe] hydrogenase diaphorase subunit